MINFKPARMLSGNGYFFQSSVEYVIRDPETKNKLFTYSEFIKDYKDKQELKKFPIEMLDEDNNLIDIILNIKELRVGWAFKCKETQILFERKMETNGSADFLTF